MQERQAVEQHLIAKTGEAIRVATMKEVRAWLGM